MTNYKRFISYLYYYEIGQRKGNIGFARVESSDELCKVTVHCALKNVPQKSCKVFLLRRQKSQIISEEVCTAELKDGLLDVKLSFEQGIIVPGNFEFKDCIGIVLLYSKDHYIGAKWDESSITYHEAGLIEQAVHTVRETAKSTAQIEDSAQEQAILPPDRKQDIKEEPLEPAIYVVPSDEIKVIDLESRQQEIRANKEKEKEEIKEKVEVQEDDEVEIQQFDDEPSPEDDVKVAEEIDKAEESEDMVKAAGGSAAAAFNMNQWIDHPAARAILNRFVRMYPFDDGEMAECVRLEPKDIGLLPMTSWPLGNNSFLLHSYCNFRHLLFTKKLTREGCQYYLMVPGTLNPRERQLAKMFGFENFKCSRRRCMRDGEFGYWYVEIAFN